MKITNQECDTILAALRYYQDQGLADDPNKRPDDIHEIATNGGDSISLDGAGIDDLCERLNVDHEEADPIVLTPEGSRRFYDAIMNPVEPSERVREAAQRYLRHTGQTPDPIEALIEAHGGERGRWGEHEAHPRCDWIDEVMNGDTLLGYWEWVANEIHIDQAPTPVLAEGGEGKA